jgi:hypothetical protein
MSTKARWRGDRHSDKEQGNKNAVGALDKDGHPKNKIAIAEDSVGAREDRALSIRLVNHGLETKSETQVKFEASSILPVPL